MNLRLLMSTIIFYILSVSVAQGECRIIPAAFKDNKQFEMATGFLCRYVELISLPSAEKNAEIISRIKDDGFKYRKGSDQKLLEVPSDADFSIDFNHGVYSAVWLKDGVVLVECEFPAKVGLMKLENKKGLELMMIEKLRSKKGGSSPKEIPAAHEKDLSKLPFSKFYVKDGGIFITSDLANRIIFERIKGKTGSCRMLHDLAAYPVETISNVLISGYDPMNISVAMTVNQYGLEKTQLTTDIATLHDIFSDEGCMPFWGIKEQTGNGIKGIYLWKNDMGGYCHVLSLDVPVSELTSGGVVRATLHAYVRLDNLKNLFEEYSDI